MTFDETLQTIVNLSTEQKIALALDSYMNLMPILQQYDPDSKGAALACAIMGTAVAADGKLSNEEAAFIYGLFSAMDIKMTEDQIFQFVKVHSTKNVYEIVTSLASRMTAEQRAHLITFVAALCSLDDKISREEVAFIADL